MTRSHGEAEGIPSRSWFRRVATAFRRHIRYRVTRSGYLFGTAIVLVGIAAVGSANNLLFLILAAMLATLMISGVVSRLSLAGLELELVLPERIAARQPVTARLRLRNLKRFPSFAIQLSGGAASGQQILEKQITFPILPGRTTLEASTPTTFPRRGIHKENLFAIATRFPFGFVERRAPVAIESEVVIYPPLEPNERTEDLLCDLRGEVEAQRRGLGSDFYRLRPYELHESARHLDWKSSAHTGELQVREFSHQEQSEVSIYFDLGIPAGESFEFAVESSAYIVWKLSAEGARVRFRTQSDDLIAPGEVDVWTILRVLALLQPKPDASAPPPEPVAIDVLFSMDPAAFVRKGWHIVHGMTHTLS
jgi:uncharacterized protein (DUF58 family)